MDNDNHFSLTPFDQNTIGTSTQLVKSLIPYLDPQSQRLVAILVRIRELLLTIRYFSRIRVQKLEFHSNDEMLGQIKKFCSPEMSSQIDMMMKMLSMSDMMNVLSGMDGFSTENTGMADIMNLFGMMKEPGEKHANTDSAFPGFPLMGGHQKELFDSYMAELDNIFKGENEQ